MKRKPLFSARYIMIAADFEERERLSIRTLGIDDGRNFLLFGLTRRKFSSNCSPLPICTASTS